MNTQTEIQKITGGTQICSRNNSCRNSFDQLKKIPSHSPEKILVKTQGRCTQAFPPHN